MALLQILVFGGAGFIGSHLVDRLLQSGHGVITVDNLSTGALANIEHQRSCPRFQFICQDVIEPLSVAGDLDFVFHLASAANLRSYQDLALSTLQANSVGTMNTLNLARQKSAAYVLASTSEIYGNPLAHPQSESYWGNVNPTGLRAPYEESKRFAETLVSHYHRAFDLDVRIARIFNCYGPRLRKDDGRVVSEFIARALNNEPLIVFGDGQQTRSFQYVDDLVNALLALMKVQYHSPLNIGNPEEITIGHLASLIKEYTGSRSEIVSGPCRQEDPRCRLPDITLASRILGWEPEIDLCCGLHKTILWFKEQEQK